MFIVSKASQDIEYTGWLKGKNGLNKKAKSIMIKGGANVLNKKTLETLNGTFTEITAEDLKFLEQLSSFKRHCDNGWIKVVKSRAEAEKKATEEIKDDEGNVVKDGSAQLTAEDFEKAGLTPPIVKPEDMGIK